MRKNQHFLPIALGAICAVNDGCALAAPINFKQVTKQNGAQFKREFNGRDQAMKIEPNQLDLSSGQFALEWVLQTSGKAPSTLLGVFDNGHSQGLSIDLNTDIDDHLASGTTRFYLRELEGADQSFIAATFTTEEVDLYDGKSHHLVFAYDGHAITQTAALQLFVDGASIPLSIAQSPGVPRRFQKFAQQPTLGARNVRGTVNNFAQVKVDEFAFKPQLLAPATIVAHTRAAGIALLKTPVFQLDDLRTVAPTDQAAFEQRSRRFLNFVVENRDNPMETVWGKYRDFDMYALACLAIEGHDEDARRLLSETLEMIDHNFAVERRPNGDKWHLADFAMEPLLRAYFQYRPTHFPNDPVWNRLEKTAQNFLFHYGDLSENHNLLHLSLRYLTGQNWPDAVLNDGRTARVHKIEADAQIRQWLNDWVRRGSGEWGADIYYNINLLALLNLYDFADDRKMRVAAQGVLDLFALDEALDSYQGAAVGAARRGYGVYRMDIKQSPSRPLQYLWFGAPTATPPFNLNFIGGAIQAATSKYLPPPAIRWIANSRVEQENTTTHARGLWPVDGLQTIGKHTLRLADAMQSTMNSPGGGGRFTEHVWQITLGETALIFANHPTLNIPVAVAGRRKTLDEILSVYNQARPANVPVTKGAWYWAYANVPPGHQGDVRPGFWQGNFVGPRAFGTGDQSFLIFAIPADNPLPYAHVYLPRREFDEVREVENWLYLRKGNGYAALWLPTGYDKTTSGLWANVELRLKNPRSAIFSVIGDQTRDGNFETFIARCKYLQPQWDAQNLTLSALAKRDGERIGVSFADGPSQNGQPIEMAGPRFQTPWGAMKFGTRTLQLKTPGGDYALDLRAVLR